MKQLLKWNTIYQLNISDIKYALVNAKYIFHNFPILERPNFSVHTVEVLLVLTKQSDLAAALKQLTVIKFIKYIFTLQIIQNNVYKQINLLF